MAGHSASTTPSAATSTLSRARTCSSKWRLERGAAEKEIHAELTEVGRFKTSFDRRPSYSFGLNSSIAAFRSSSWAPCQTFQPFTEALAPLAPWPAL
jgi:hypothetical protein